MEAGSWAKGVVGLGRSMASWDHQPCFLLGALRWRGQVLLYYTLPTTFFFS